MRWLVLRLRAPLASFGGEAIDSRGVTRDFPAASALTGLLGNAMGYERWDTDALQGLQERLVFGARREAEHALGRLTDFQTAQLGAGDRGWTRTGAEGRAGGAATYDSPHIRWREHHADADLTCVLRLVPEAAPPTLDDLAAALDRPARPLFLGRKACLPSGYINGGFLEAMTARDALQALPLSLPAGPAGPAGPAAPAATDVRLRAIWPADESQEGADRVIDLTDQRNWRSGLHGGARRVAEGHVNVRPAVEP